MRQFECSCQFNQNDQFKIYLQVSIYRRRRYPSIHTVLSFERLNGPRTGRHAGAQIQI